MRNICIFCCVIFLGQSARANDVDSLDLMRALVAEVGRDGSIAECVAILHVFRTRGGRLNKNEATIARLYSVALNGRATNRTRAARMRGLTLKEIPAHIRRVVERWQRGIRPRSVCAGARHFAHPSLPTPLVRVTCATETRNAFWR